MGIGGYFVGGFDELPDEVQERLKKQHDMEHMAHDAAQAAFVRVLESFDAEQTDFLIRAFDTCATEGSRHAAYMAGLLTAGMIWHHDKFGPKPSDAEETTDE